MIETTSFPWTLDRLREYRTEIIALARRYGAYNVRVFGSLARGTSRPDSDVDLLVSFGTDASLYEFSGLWQDLQELLDCKVDLVMDNKNPRREQFMRQILGEAVIL